MAKIKRDDQVVVLTGKDKGKRGYRAEGARQWSFDGFWHQYDQEAHQA